MEQVSSSPPEILQSVNDFDPRRLNFVDKVFVTNTSAKLVSFLYDGHPLYVQTPVSVCPFGYRPPFDTQSSRTHETLTVNTTQRSMDLFNAIDEAVMDTIMKRSEVWFEKKFTNRDVLRELFNSTVKTRKNYPSYVSVRFKFPNGVPSFGVFDKNKDEIRITDPSELMTVIPRKTSARFVLTSSSIWYIGGRCGFSWDILQIQICNSPMLTNVRQYMFIDDDDDEDASIVHHIDRKRKSTPSNDETNEDAEERTLP